MVYITVANSKRILRKLDLNDLDLTGQVYDKPLFFLNKREEQERVYPKQRTEAEKMSMQPIWKISRICVP